MHVFYSCLSKFLADRITEQLATMLQTYSKHTEPGCKEVGNLEIEQVWMTCLCLSKKAANTLIWEGKASFGIGIGAVLAKADVEKGC